MSSAQPSPSNKATDDADHNSHRMLLPNGKMIYDIGKLLEVHSTKNELVKSYDNQSSKVPLSARTYGYNENRYPYGKHFAFEANTKDIPDVAYNTDCGPMKTIQKSVNDGPNPCLSIFKSGKERFASDVKEPYDTPENIGPGTYRAKRRAIQVKNRHIPTPGYIDRVSKFKDAKAKVSVILSNEGPNANIPAARTNKDTIQSHQDKILLKENNMSGLTISTSPRFKSMTFPEKYVSSKQYHIEVPSPDKFYDISPTCKFTIQTAVETSKFRVSTMQSRSSRLSSEASMIHNTPNFPNLPSSTTNHIGPGTYATSIPSPPDRNNNTNFVMMPQQYDRFGLPDANSQFIEARFRRFPVQAKKQK